MDALPTLCIIQKRHKVNDSIIQKCPKVNDIAIYF